MYFSGKRFKKLDLDGSGSLSIDEFMSLPELQQNPLVRRVIGEFQEIKVNPFFGDNVKKTSKHDDDVIYESP